jgi:hypothetical protein
MKKQLLFYCLILTIYLQAADTSTVTCYKTSIDSFAQLSEALLNCGVVVGSDTCVGIDYDATLVAKYLMLPGKNKLYYLLNEETKNPDDQAYHEAIKVKESLDLKDDSDLAKEALMRGGYADLMLNSLKLYTDQLPKEINQDLVVNIPPQQQVAGAYIKQCAKEAFIDDISVIKPVIKSLQMKGAFVTVASAGGASDSRAFNARSTGIKFWISGASKFQNLNGTSFSKLQSLMQRDEFGNAEDLGVTPLEKQGEMLRSDEQSPIDRFSTYILVDNSMGSINTFLAAAQKAVLDGQLKDNTKVVGIHYNSEYNQITADKLLKEFHDISGTVPAASSGWLGYLLGYRG